MKLQIGTPVLVVGPYLHERAEVIKAEKGVYTLNNNLQINRDYQVLSKSEFKAEPWDEDRYNYLQAKSLMVRYINNIKENYTKLNEEDTVSLFNRLSKINAKYFGEVCKF